MPRYEPDISFIQVRNTTAWDNLLHISQKVWVFQAITAYLNLWITCHMSDKLLWQARFEVLTVTLLWIQVFWDVTMCSCMSGSWCFKGSVFLNAWSQAVQEKLFFLDWLKMKATRSFWTLGNSNTKTQCHNPQDFYPVKGFYYGCVFAHVKTHKKLLPQWISLQFTEVQHITSMAYCKQDVCSCQSFRNRQPKKFWNEMLMYDG
jgi:hypothetical protein